MSVPTQYLYVRCILSHRAPMNEQSPAHQHIEHVSIAYFLKACGERHADEVESRGRLIGTREIKF